MFYTYRQNNSGGAFVYNEQHGISVLVIIEAYNAEQADARAELVGLYFDGQGDCSCCGNRWNNAWEEDGSEMPTEAYGDKPIDLSAPMPEPNYRWMRKPGQFEGFVHYLDGRVVGFWQQN